MSISKNRLPSSLRFSAKPWKLHGRRPDAPGSQAPLTKDRDGSHVPDRCDHSGPPLVTALAALLPVHFGKIPPDPTRTIGHFRSVSAESPFLDHLYLIRYVDAETQD